MYPSIASHSSRTDTVYPTCPCPLTAPRSFHRQLHSSLAQLTISINDPYDDKAGASSEEKPVIDLD